ncbi:MAG: sigma-70 family RNA polymerase sigma factor [Planctomycetes bacterium]|nr:sigma-70 family RNA polymerase sigma factor [Planctomycetota bacterium]NOG53071.1 sigma-70 family RNA polymerase sigma factor [Planctomycetota bacterium]
MAEGDFFSIEQDTAAIASGDTDAFARFYNAWFEPMYAEAKRSTKCDESMCLDIVQDAMVRAIHRMVAFQDETELRAWLRVLVRCSAIDRIRAEQRRRARERTFESTSSRDRPSGRPQPDEPADLQERLAWLRAELGSMDSKGARLLTMRYKLGWTLDRISRATGLTPSAVDGRIRRVVADLRGRAGKVFADD